MELTFNELKKRDVINIVDGRSLGVITDIRLDFPEGKLIGIYVPGRKANFFSRLFDKTSVYVDESRIIKIGGDVILVNLRCDESCTGAIKKGKRPNSNASCAPNCAPPRPPKSREGEIDFSALSGGERFDGDDY